MYNKFYITNLPDEKYISEINFVGTHDSCANNVEYKDIARCQNLSIIDQLQSGIRLFDIRLSYSNAKYPLVHYLADCYVYKGNKYKLYFEYILSIFERFLKNNPKETIVLSIKKDRGILRYAFAEEFFKRFVDDRKELWYLENHIPTLKEVRGKIVLMRRFYCLPNIVKNRGMDSLGLDFSKWDNQNSKKPHPPFLTKIGEEAYAIIQDSYNVSKEDKWNDLIKPFLQFASPSQERVCINFLNSSRGESPKEISNYINSNLMDYLESNQLRGWILLDFANENIINKILNQQHM